VLLSWLMLDVLLRAGALLVGGGELMESELSAGRLVGGLFSLEGVLVELPVELLLDLFLCFFALFFFLCFLVWASLYSSFCLCGNI
jgi:hypothetical protein